MYPTATATAPAVTHRGGQSALAELFEVILDRGLVIDAHVRVSLIGIELLTIDARVVLASVDTYLHFAEAVNRLDLQSNQSAWNIADLGGIGDDAASAAKEQLNELKESIPFLSGESEQRQEQES